MRTIFSGVNPLRFGMLMLSGYNRYKYCAVYVLASKQERWNGNVPRLSAVLTRSSSSETSNWQNSGDRRRAAWWSSVQSMWFFWWKALGLTFRMDCSCEINSDSWSSSWFWHRSAIESYAKRLEDILPPFIIVAVLSINERCWLFSFNPICYWADVLVTVTDAVVDLISSTKSPGGWQWTTFVKTSVKYYWTIQS